MQHRQYSLHVLQSMCAQLKALQIVVDDVDTLSNLFLGSMHVFQIKGEIDRKAEQLVHTSCRAS